MKRLDRRTFVLLASVGSTGAVLTACGNDPDEVDLNPTMIPVEGAPPTLAPNATPGGGAEEATPEAGSGEAGGGTTAEVTAVDIDFEPAELSIAADTDVTITVHNDGALEHDLIIEDTDFGTDLIPGGESVELVVNLPEGEYTYYCSVTGHREAGMEGTLTVAAGGGEEAPAEEEAAGGEVPAAGGATTAEVTAVDIDFEPAELSIAADTDVTITVHNDGALEHDFVIENTDFATDLIPGGESVELVVNFPEGEYTYFCSVTGHREAGMEGKTPRLRPPRGERRLPPVSSSRS
jgi:plastocyanin